MDITIRDYQKKDAASLAAIYYNTIHHVAIRDYNEKQVNAWAPKSSLETKGWMEKWKKLAPFVAVINNTPVGFAEFESNGHIDCFYVHHDYQRKGIGSTLMNAIFNRASTHGIKRLYAEVSITAKPFFEKEGFNVVKPQTVTIRGEQLKNFIMEKIS